MALVTIEKMPRLKTIDGSPLYGEGNIEIPKTPPEIQLVTINDEGLKGTGNISIGSQNLYGTLEIDTENWNLDQQSKTYTKTINVDEITSDDHPIITLLINDYSNKSDIYRAWSHIYKAESGSDNITFYSDSEISTNLTVQYFVYRDVETKRTEESN